MKWERNLFSQNESTRRFSAERHKEDLGDGEYQKLFCSYFTKLKNYVFSDMKVDLSFVLYSVS